MRDQEIGLQRAQLINNVRNANCTASFLLKYNFRERISSGEKVLLKKVCNSKYKLHNRKN